MVIRVYGQGMSIGIEQLEAAAHIGEAGAGAPLHLMRLWHDFIDHEGMKVVLVYIDPDLDHTGLMCADTVFKGILYKGHQYERRYLIALCAAGDGIVYGNLVSEAQLLELYIFGEDAEVPVEWHEFILRIAEDIAHDVGEAHDGLRCIVGLLQREAIDIVERIEEEVRVDLRLEQGELGDGLLVADVFGLLLCAIPLFDNAQAGTDDKDDGKYQGRKKNPYQDAIGIVRILDIHTRIMKANHDGWQAHKDGHGPENGKHIPHAMAAPEQARDEHEGIEIIEDYIGGVEDHEDQVKPFGVLVLWYGRACGMHIGDVHHIVEEIVRYAQEYEPERDMQDYGKGFIFHCRPNVRNSAH
ncbi:MAG: hypothetical protein JWO03_758 [Bacteroidetes bacterium]|nr:hypothetical protein [Bacteroidota bacterium]